MEATLFSGWIYDTLKPFAAEFTLHGFDGDRGRLATLMACAPRHDRHGIRLSHLDVSECCFDPACSQLIQCTAPGRRSMDLCGTPKASLRSQEIGYAQGVDLIDRLRVKRRRGTDLPATIELLKGDLSEIPPEHAVDALVVSAYPNSYTPNPGTLFAHLLRRGLDMQEVAQQKQEDQRECLGCWISRPLPAELSYRFNFGRIVCFEPRYPAFVMKTGFDSSSIEDTVGYVFRCLNNFVIPEANGPHEVRRFNVTRVAMPLLATGNQRVPIEALLPKLLDAAVFWLEEGLPIECLKIVAFTPAQADVAARLFSAKTSSGPPPGLAPAVASDKNVSWELALAGIIAAQLIETCTDRLRDELLALAKDDERPILCALFDRLASARALCSNGEPIVSNVTGVAMPEYDVFVSYAHKQDQEVLAFVREMERYYPHSRIFYDHSSIPAGGQWLKMISEAVQKAQMFVAVLSPDYSASPVCWDEFQCAKLKEYNTRMPAIRTVRLYSERELPPIMGVYSYVDCIEGDLEKLRGCAATILAPISPR